MNYNSLINKPTLNHKELIGDNKAADVGGMTEESMEQLLATDLTPYYTKAEIDELFARSYVYRVKSGSIVTFECPSTAQSIPEVTSEIEATQDLHGYDHPWPAGGGKNKINTIADNIVYYNYLPADAPTFNNSVITWTIGAGTYFFLLKAFEITSAMVGKTYVMSYTTNHALSSNTMFVICDIDGSNRQTVSTVVTIDSAHVGKLLTIRFYSAEANTYTISNVQVEEGSTATSYAPYENECPITGKSAVNVYRTSKNLVDISRMDGTTGITYSDGVASGLVTAFASAFNEASGGITRISDIKFPIADRLTISLSAYTTATAGTTGAGLRIVTKYTDGTTENLQFGNNTTTNTKQSITTAENKIIQSIYFSYGSLANTWYVSELQVELGTTATEYETFSGTTYTTTLKDGNNQPLTCYGGELSNENGVQTLTVTHANISSFNGETINEPWISSMDVYATGTTPTTGAQVVYPLTTPEEITQDTLAISSVAGTNNIWTDSGDITVKALDKIIQE